MKIEINDQEYSRIVNIKLTEHELAVLAYSILAFWRSRRAGGNVTSLTHQTKAKVVSLDIDVEVSDK